jgi:hypothetical protein
MKNKVLFVHGTLVYNYSIKNHEYNFDIIKIVSDRKHKETKRYTQGNYRPIKLLAKRSFSINTYEAHTHRH